MRREFDSTDARHDCQDILVYIEQKALLVNDITDSNMKNEGPLMSSDVQPKSVQSYLITPEMTAIQSVSGVSELSFLPLSKSSQLIVGRFNFFRWLSPTLA
jgi:hypothetical protein